jgi:hypothetical protein
VDKPALTEIETRLLEVNEVIKKLDESIRVAAFEFLKPYVVGGTIKVNKPHEAPADPGGSSDDLAAMVLQYGSDEKPSENAKLLSAWWFSQYGAAPFSTKWIKETGASSGLTFPEKPDMTFRQAKSKGKGLYEALGEGGLIKPTISGEQYLKTTYGVKKGTKPVPAST